ncbi:hypothetical protein HRbin04_01003 [archaeon HR04]|nr:hypothetical protein HRbin04_01003 [archaeon HR04]
MLGNEWYGSSGSSGSTMLLRTFLIKEHRGSIEGLLLLVVDETK